MGIYLYIDKHNSSYFSGHPTCLQYSKDLTARVMKETWQCIECKVCNLCKEQGDPVRKIVSQFLIPHPLSSLICDFEYRKILTDPGFIFPVVILKSEVSVNMNTSDYQ